MTSAAKLARQNQQAAINKLPIPFFVTIIIVPRESTLSSSEAFKRLEKKYSLQNRPRIRHGTLRK
jgi:hypothetical protein